MVFTTAYFKKALLDIAEVIEKEKDYLSDLDRAIGDGDHGVTMSIGWQAIKEKLQEFSDESDCSDLCKAVGMTFLNAVGSSVGPLYATAFIRGAAVLQGKKELNDEDIVGFWVAAVRGIQERGKAEPGDKTMMDTWLPAVDSLQSAHREGKGLADCLEAAVAAGEKGMQSTKDMLSLKGRSSRIGERALGHQDPGATSAYMLLASFHQSLKSFEQDAKRNPS